MTGELEAMADTATGTLAARAIEDESKPSADGHTHESHCLNCHAALIGSHCHHCGQHAHVHRTLGGFGHDILHGVFHFEGRIWGTLPLLAWRPGELTRRYAHGERAKFVSPTALFLFCVFLMFVTFHSVGGPIRLHSDVNIEQAGHEIAAARTRRTAELHALDGAIAAAQRAGRPVDALRRSRANMAKEIEGIDNVGSAANLLAAAGDGPSDWKIANGHTGIAGIDAGIEHFNANPELALYKLQSSAYKYSWLLIPISLPFMWLLFPFRRGATMYDHAVFVTYSLCFMTLLTVTLSLAAAIGLSAGWALAALAFVPPVHIYRQIRGAYLSSRIGALLRTALLLVFIGFTAAFFFLALLALGAMG